MQFATVSSSDIFKYNRMDATFHIAVKKITPKVEELKGKISEKDALNKILALKTSDLTCLDPLTTGNGKPGRAEYITAAEKYPLIAYAMILENIEKIEENAKAEISAAEDYNSAVKSIRLK